MDEFHRRELERQLEAGIENHAPWDFAKRRVRELGRRQGQVGLPGAPTEAEVEEFLRDAHGWYMIASANGSNGADGAWM